MRWLGFTVAFAIAATPRAAVADDRANPHLQAARDAKLVLQYDQALAHLARAESWGENSPEQLRELYRLGGELAGGLGRDDVAAEYFQKLLALDPTASLPAGTSPKVTGPFERAREALDGEGGLQARYELAGGPAVVVIVDADPAHQVAGARVRVRQAGAARVVEGRGGERIEIPVATGSALDIAVLDGYGNELVRIGRPYAIRALALGGGANFDGGAVIDGGDELGHPGWPYAAGGAVLALGAATYFAFDARDARDEWERVVDAGGEASRALDLEDRAERSTAISAVSFVAAGALAGTATWLYVRRLRERRRRAAVILAPMPGGAAAILAGTF
jgi:tetratricopeptide (TPR) repeat protein